MTLLDAMDRKVSNKRGRELYRQHQAIIEAIFGQIKHLRGIHSLMRRGKRGRLGVETHLRHAQPLEALPPRACRVRYRALQPTGGIPDRMKAR